MKTRNVVYFSLTGSFVPDEVTTELEINPNKTWRKGESIQGTLSSYKHDGWRISTEPSTEIDLSVQIESLLLLIYPLKEKVLNICQEKKVNAEISCSIDVEDNKYPIIFLSKKIIGLIYELNVDFDIDIF